MDRLMTTPGHPSADDPVLSIATPTFLRLPADATCAAAVADFARARDAADTACVIAADGGLLGIVTLRDCLSLPGTGAVAGAMRTGLVSAPVSSGAEAACRLLLDTDQPALPIVDDDGRPLGVLPARDAYRFLFEMADEDAAKTVGIVGDRHDYDDYLGLSVWADFRRRMPWILGLAVAGLAAGYVVHIYEDALDALVILALYMPMVADTGGNVGTQSASLVTRALSFGGVSFGDAARVLWREARVAALMAAMLFLFAYLKVLFISNSADVPLGLDLGMIGTAIGVALALQVVSATLIGALLPLGAVAVRQDPAIVSGPALTTIVDLTGLLIYFSVTTKMLGIDVFPG